MPPIGQIDSHQHFWRLERGDYGWLRPEMAPLYRDFGPADLAPLLQRHGIAGTVLVQAAPTVAETEFMLGIAAETAFVKGVVGWVDLESTTAPAEVDRLAAHPKLKGFRPMIQDIPDPEWMLCATIAPAVARLQHEGLSFDALVRPRQLEPLRRFLLLYPDLPIVVDHGAKPDIAHGQFEGWAREMREVAADPRVYCKISGLVTEAAPDWQPGDLARYLDLLLDAFGPARLMWGSDWPVVDLAGGYDRWRAAVLDYLARLEEEECAAILGGTAAEFYRLS
jgi:L-fuconolactonase